ncbi:MAG: STN domain-containing protein [Rhizobiales bacterium]|nr:STN domain-containing protein [Hyphomicrobiales bacterium]
MTTGTGASAQAGLRTKRRLASLLVTSALLAVTTSLAAQPALAQPAPANAANQAVAFSIPAQPLSAAVNAFIGVTGWQISYSSALARGKNSAAVVGTMTPAQALQRLVAGTGRRTAPRSSTSST